MLVMQTPETGRRGFSLPTLEFCTISQSSYVIQTIIKLPRQNLVYRAETGSHRAEVGCYRPENLSTALK